MDKPRILISVSGGNVQYIAANQEIDVILIDHDNLEAGDKFDIDSFYTADSILSNDELNAMALEETKKYNDNED